MEAKHVCRFCGAEALSCVRLEVAGITTESRHCGSIECSKKAWGMGGTSPTEGMDALFGKGRIVLVAELEKNAMLKDTP